MENCPECQSKNIVKLGFIVRKSGKVQKYKCNDCKSVRAENRVYSRITADQKDMIDSMVSEGIAYRKIQRLLKIKSVYTVCLYLKKKPTS